MKLFLLVVALAACGLAQYSNFMKRSVVAFVAYCMSLTGLSAMTVQQYRFYQRRPASSPEIKAYVTGIGDGFMMANSELRLYGGATLLTGKQMYCQPPNLVMETENYITILDRKIAAMAREMDSLLLAGSEISGVLLKGLQETFPCRPAK